MAGPIYSMIFTHDGRMRCMVRKLLQEHYNKDKYVELSSNVKLPYGVKVKGRRPLEPITEENEERTISTDSVASSNFVSARGSEADFSDSDDESPVSFSEHQGLLKSAKLRKNRPIFIGGSDDIEIERFMNCSILEVTINMDTITINLIYSGNLAEKKPERVYFVTQPDYEEIKNKSPQELGYKPTPFFEVSVKNNFYPLNGKDKFVFYIVRHGQGTHNVKKSMETDTSLTGPGTGQAYAAGDYFRKYISYGYAKMPQFLFISDLKRTRQTLENFLSGTKTRIRAPIAVLPCSHELIYKKDGNCDGAQGITAPENTTSYSGSNHEKFDTASVNYESSDSSSSSPLVQGMYIEWGPYKKFYGTGKRGMICTRMNCGTQHCRKTDMIKEAIEMIKTSTSSASPEQFRFKEYGGGRKTRKKRKTKKIRRIHARGGTLGRLSQKAMLRQQEIVFKHLLEHHVGLEDAEVEFKKYLKEVNQPEMLGPRLRKRIYVNIEKVIIDDPKFETDTHDVRYPKGGKRTRRRKQTKRKKYKKKSEHSKKLKTRKHKKNGKRKTIKSKRGGSNKRGRVGDVPYGEIENEEMEIGNLESIDSYEGYEGESDDNSMNQEMGEPDINSVKIYQESEDDNISPNSNEFTQYLRSKGLDDGDIFEYEEYDKGFAVLAGDKMIPVGPNSDTYNNFMFDKEATQYTNNFFEKYKKLLERSDRPGGSFDLRSDDNFIVKHMGNVPNVRSVVDIDDDDDEEEGIISIRQYSIDESNELDNQLVRRKTIQGDLRSILNGREGVIDMF